MPSFQSVPPDLCLHVQTMQPGLRTTITFEQKFAKFAVIAMAFNVFILPIEYGKETLTDSYTYQLVLYDCYYLVFLTAGTFPVSDISRECEPVNWSRVPGIPVRGELVTNPMCSRCAERSVRSSY